MIVDMFSIKYIHIDGSLKTVVQILAEWSNRIHQLTIGYINDVLNLKKTIFNVFM